jgi:hypothetical protein
VGHPQAYPACILKLTNFTHFVSIGAWLSCLVIETAQIYEAFKYEKAKQKKKK